MIQEGAIGLLKAIENFDYKKGFKFSTYAKFWIKQSITKAIMDKGDNIRLSTNRHENLRELKKELEKISSELKRMPTVKELANILNLTEEKAAKLIMSLGYKTTSLDKKIEKDGEELQSLVDLIVDEKALNPEEETIKTISLEEMKNVIDTVLNKKDSEIVKKRYGFEDGYPRTLQAIGEEYDLTRERIRQIESRALRRLEIYLNTKEEQHELKDCVC